MCNPYVRLMLFLGTGFIAFLCARKINALLSVGLMLATYSLSALYYGNIIAGPFGGARIERSREKIKFYTYVSFFLIVGVGFVISAISNSN